MAAHSSKNKMMSPLTVAHPDGPSSEEHHDPPSLVNSPSIAPPPQAQTLSTESSFEELFLEDDPHNAVVLVPKEVNINMNGLNKPLSGISSSRSSSTSRQLILVEEPSVLSLRHNSLSLSESKTTNSSLSLSLRSELSNQSNGSGSRGGKGNTSRDEGGGKGNTNRRSTAKKPKHMMVKNGVVASMAAEFSSELASKGETEMLVGNKGAVVPRASAALKRRSVDVAISGGLADSSGDDGSGSATIELKKTNSCNLLSQRSSKKQRSFKKHAPRHYGNMSLRASAGKVLEIQDVKEVRYAPAFADPARISAPPSVPAQAQQGRQPRHISSAHQKKEHLHTQRGAGGRHGHRNSLKATNPLGGAKGANNCPATKLSPLSDRRAKWGETMNTKSSTSPVWTSPRSDPAGGSCNNKSNSPSKINAPQNVCTTASTISYTTTVALEKHVRWAIEADMGGGCQSLADITQIPVRVQQNRRPSGKVVMFGQNGKPAMKGHLEKVYYPSEKPSEQSERELVISVMLYDHKGK